MRIKRLRKKIKIKEPRGHTLIELALAMALVAILAYAASGTSPHSVDDARIEAIKVDAAVFDNAVRTYYKDKGYFKNTKGNDGVWYETTNMNITQNYVPDINDLIDMGYLNFKPLGIQTGSWSALGSKNGEHNCVFRYEFVRYKNDNGKETVTPERHITVRNCDRTGSTIISGRIKTIVSTGNSYSST